MDIHPIHILKCNLFDTFLFQIDFFFYLVMKPPDFLFYINEYWFFYTIKPNFFFITQAHYWFFDITKPNNFNIKKCWTIYISINKEKCRGGVQRHCRHWPRPSSDELTTDDRTSVHFLVNHGGAPVIGWWCMVVFGCPSAEVRW